MYKIKVRFCQEEDNRIKDKAKQEKKSLHISYVRVKIKLVLFFADSLQKKTRF